MRILDAQSSIPLTGGKFSLHYDGGTVMQDGDEADAYHGVVNWAGFVVSSD